MSGLAMHRLHVQPGEMVSDEEIALRREQLRFGHAAAAAVLGRKLEPWQAALLDACASVPHVLPTAQPAIPMPYPPDGGLKAPVRAFEDTPSLTDVVSQEMRRRAQQQDPAHDQGPFPYTRDTTISWVPQEAITGKRAEQFIIDDPISVTGSMVVTFQDQKLFDRMTKGESYPPAWQQNLMWAAHNLIAHPLSEVLHWFGYLHPKIRDFGLWLHDITVPRHAPNTGRG